MRKGLSWMASMSACLAAAVALAEEPPQGVLRAYVSAVDGSRQQYGVYVPRANPPSEAGYPVVMHAHGYGWWVGAEFSLWQRQWADDHGWVLVNVNGRGPNFYDGIGEDDVMRVLEDVGRLVAVDRSRVYMTGGSMGGTGAYRMGVRRPDVFSGAAPVDGWTDFREFHWHWYARKDMRDAIEEFRRPLLEAISPLYVAGTARWGNVQLIVDALDTVVLPRQGLDMSEAFEARKADAPEAYRNELVYHLDRGHGAGYDLRRIYARFLAVSGLERPPAVTIEATLLRYGRIHWAAIDRFGVQGAIGRLHAETSESAAYVSPENVEAFTLSLPDSPLAGRERVQVVVEGVPCYDGPPTEVALELRPDPLSGARTWRPADTERTGLRKRRGLEGPIGEAFLAPFTVVWGTAGAGASVRQGQTEAEDFANEWNAFNVHYNAVRAKPEDELTHDEATSTNVIVFGTLDSSSLLRRMAASCDLPVQVYDDRVLVRDPANGDRVYRGAKYGAYWVYPNPLTGFRTLVVGCRGRFATKPDGSVPRGLGYDLEKLQWAWGDYVVFDSDIEDLPYVENVNDKPPVLAYEAAYFVEAGFHDQDWRPNRGVELSRVLATRPDGSRLIHIDSLCAVGDGDGRPAGVEVRIVDDGGRPVRQARVTVSWSVGGGTFSRPTDENGTAFFAAPEQAAAETIEATVVNVCATGGTYSWGDDRGRTVLVAPGASNRIRAIGVPERAETAAGNAVPFAVRVRNAGSVPAEVTVSAPNGVAPASQTLAVAPGGEAEAPLVWEPGDRPAGEYPVPITVSARAGGLGRTVATTTPVFTIRASQTVDVAVVSVGAPDRRRGEPFEVTAEIENRDESRDVWVTATCVIVEARRYLPTQEVRLPAKGKVTLCWRPAEGSRPLESGVYTATVSVPEVPGAVGRATFVVK